LGVKSDRLDQDEGKWSLSLGITLPIFDRNKGPIAAALARRDAQAARFLELQNRIMADVDRALAAKQAAARDVATARQMRETAAQLTRARAEQLAAGDISRVELARAEIELADAMRA
jgi:outer membrane protein TolC